MPAAGALEGGNWYGPLPAGFEVHVPKQCKHKCPEEWVCAHRCCRKWFSALTEAKTKLARLTIVPFKPDSIRHGPTLDLPPPKPLHTGIHGRRFRKGIAANDPPLLLHELRNSSNFLDTQELFEMALKFLSPDDLLRLKGVNKHFRDTINGKAMKKSMFLEADQNVIKIRGTNSNGISPKREMTVRTFNLALFTVDQKIPVLGLTQLRCRGHPLSLQPDDARLKMLVTQPPCTEVTLYISTSVPSKKTKSSRARKHFGSLLIGVKNRNGVQFGDFVKHFQAELKKQGPGAKIDADLCYLTLSETLGQEDGNKALAGHYFRG